MSKVSSLTKHHKPPPPMHPLQQPTKGDCYLDTSYLSSPHNNRCFEYQRHSPAEQRQKQPEKQFHSGSF